MNGAQINTDLAQCVSIRMTQDIVIHPQKLVWTQVHEIWMCNKHACVNSAPQITDPAHCTCVSTA